jgi:alkaline phosphatase D
VKTFLALTFLLMYASALQGQQVRLHQLDIRNFESPDKIELRSSSPFMHGVASGDPLSDAVIIWTRISPADFSNEVEVEWTVATDVAMQEVVQQGTFITDADRDFTVKVDVQGLNAGTYYYYQFKVLNQRSIIGRTLTAAENTLDRMRIAAVSCSDYRAGYFHGYKNLAARNDLSLILHLGDYFYETGGGPEDRMHDPDAEIYRLDDYRTRYSQYRLDPDLQRAHQVHPFSTIWDDHDIVVDALRDTSFRHNADAFGPYADRKAAAVRAALEWLPIRDDITDSLKIWRSFQYGDLAEIFMLDTRLYDRDRFATDATDTIYQQEDHKLIGPAQLTWLQNGLSNSTAHWKILGNQVMMGHLQALEDEPLIFENWAGYTAERDSLFQHMISNEVENTLVLTGDFHISMALELATDPRDPAQYNPTNGEGSLGVEFLVPSLTGENFDEGETFGFSTAAQASFLIGLGNEHIRWNELEGHGYVLLDLNPDRAQAEFWHIEDISDPSNSGEVALNQFASENGSQIVRRSENLSNPITGLPPLPPLDTIADLDAAQIVLLRAGPNPFNEQLILNLLVPVTGEGQIEVVNLQGQQILNEQLLFESAGNYGIELETADWESGNYLIQIRLGDLALSTKMSKFRP